MPIARRTFFQVGAVFGAAAMTGCTVARNGAPAPATTTPATTTPAGSPMRLGVAEYPPYVFLDETGLTGQVVEVAEAAFGRLGVGLEIELVPYDALRPGLSDGGFDAVGAVRLVEDNCAWIPHYVADHLSNSAFAVLAGNPLRLNTFADVGAKNARVLVVEGSLEAPAAAGVPNAATAPNAEVALTMLAEGRADCFAYDDITLRYLTARRPELGVGRTFEPPGGAAVYGFGFASAHGAAAASFSDALAALRESGVWRRVAEPFGFTEPNELPDEDVDRTCEQ